MGPPPPPRSGAELSKLEVVRFRGAEESFWSKLIGAEGARENFLIG